MQSEGQPSHRHLRLVVVSPEDVAEEAAAVDSVVARLNRQIAHDRGIHIDVYRWKTDAYPGFHPEGYQKGVLDPILCIDGADIVVGIFWTRLGTPAVDGKTGAQHEIDNALAASGASGGARPRHICVYWSHAPVSQEENRNERALKQKLALVSYIESLKERGLVVGSYDGPRDFPNSLLEHLSNFLRKTYPLDSSPGATDDADVSLTLSEADDARFLKQYRERLGALHEKWDLGSAGVPDRGPRGLNPSLEDMYVSISFGDPNGPNPRQRQALEPADLASQEGALILRGAAGSGKTTWMRFTFRRLLDGQLGYLPIFVELRALALNWRNKPGQGLTRSFEAYLEDWASSYGCDGRQLVAYIRTWRPGRPVPLLLVDGWDELGELGRELRAKLVGFRKAWPHARVVVTSRLYGIEPPSTSDGYKVLDILPLDQRGIKQLVERFHRQCHGDDPAAVKTKTEQFVQALKASPSAGSLARIPLQLTMMLALHRVSPLPVRRHRLYDACLRSFLSARVDRAEQEGAQRQVDQWRPEDPRERLRAAARLAYEMQAKAWEWKPFSKKVERKPITLAVDSLVQYLPEEWSPTERVGFLSWLVGPAALLSERADGTVQFSHLSYQEFLAASLCKMQWDAERREREFVNRCREPRWWETLRLWAGLISDDAPERLTPLLTKVIENEGDVFPKEDKGLHLVGAILADGNGTDAALRMWAERYVDAAGGRPGSFTGMTREAWNATALVERKHLISSTWSSISGAGTWANHLRIQAWLGESHELPLPSAPMARTVLRLRQRCPADAREIAVGRVWTHVRPTWPEAEPRLALLQLWPGQRRIAGLRLQTVASLCIEPPARFLRMALSWAPPKPEKAGQLTKTIAGGFWLEGLTDPSKEQLARDIAEYSARYHSQMPTSYGFIALVAKSLLAADDSRRFGAELGELQHVLRGEFTGLVEWLAPLWGLDIETADAMTCLEVLGGGGAWATARLARLDPEGLVGELAVMAAAARAFFDERAIPELERQIDAYSRNGSDPDPLWPALARHVARISTSSDRSLLEDLVRHPERRPAPLSHGLQFIARGDVWLHYDRVVTLDELCARIGARDLPYLEDSPALVSMPSEKVRPQGARKARKAQSGQRT
jgi:hypothetical protein